MPGRRPPPDETSLGGWSDPGASGGTAPQDATPLEHPGPPLERYAIGALLGRGGMGVVHAARDTALGRDVALKELQPELADDIRAAARLAREAAITSRLDHPGPRRRCRRTSPRVAVATVSVAASEADG